MTITHECQPREMQEMEFNVKMTVPSQMNTEEVEKALHTCISFGRPRITKLQVPAVTRCTPV